MITKSTSIVTNMQNEVMNNFLRTCVYHFGYAFFFSMFINVLQLTFSIYMLQVYDRVLTSYNLPTLWVITLAALVSLFVLMLLEWLRSRLLIRAGIELNDRVSEAVLTKALFAAATPFGFQGQATPRDVQILRNFLGGSAVFAFFDMPWMPLYFALIFVLHPVLGLVATAGGIIVVILGVLTQRLTTRRVEAATRLNAESGAFLSVAMRNINSVKAMGMTEPVVHKWQSLNDHVIELQTVASNTAGLLHAIGKSFRLAMQVLIYAAGAYLAVLHESTPGIMIAASIIMGRALSPLDQAMATYRQSLEAKNAYNKIRATLAAQANVPQSSMRLPAPRGVLSVEGAHCIIKGRAILTPLSFTLEAGRSLAIIGPSASGKSTLCKLLLGLWRPSGGIVRLDQADITTWNPNELGRHLGYLPQEVELFPGTVAENIARLGAVDSEAVIRAATFAGVHNLILGLPEGYDTKVGERGEALSGGQRQRIGLARALYGDPSFIVLDEPNANLDEEGDRALMYSLEALKRKAVTVIMVTHKPAVLAVADRIMLLQDGRMTLFGERADVMAKIEAARKREQQVRHNMDAARLRREALSQLEERKVS